MLRLLSRNKGYANNKCFAFDTNHNLKYTGGYIKYRIAGFIIYDTQISIFTSCSQLFEFFHASSFLSCLPIRFYSYATGSQRCQAII